MSPNSRWYRKRSPVPAVIIHTKTTAAATLPIVHAMAKRAAAGRSARGGDSLADGDASTSASRVMGPQTIGRGREGRGAAAAEEVLLRVRGRRARHRARRRRLVSDATAFRAGPRARTATDRRRLW